jgi:hypothetical protein
MKRLISKMIIAVLVALFVCNYSFAASAKVTFVKGKVEVSRGNAWVALKVGDLVNESETISTGFQSEARLNYNGSVMAVPALSRVTLETLKSTSSKETVSLKVDTGAVRSKVTHTSGKKIEYEARTSVGVASVRGTDFAVLSTGEALVYSGAIVYYDISEYVPKNYSSDEEEEEEVTLVDDEGPADSTTPAGEITSTAPKGAQVVGAGQRSKIEDGKTSNPFDEAKTRNTKAKTAVGSAASKDTAAAGAVTAAPVTVAAPVSDKPSGGEPSGGDPSGGEPTVQSGDIIIHPKFPVTN